MTDEIEALLAEIVRPLMEADGGGIELVSVEGQVVTVRLLGACSGCPGAPYTRAHVIIPVLQQLLGSPVEVRMERTPTRPDAQAATAPDRPDASSGGSDTGL